MNAMADSMIYAPAVRKNVGVLVMLAGPSGSGKTMSALRLAKGLAGPTGKIAFCDTEHDRALYYADQFEFLHYSLPEPFRPSRFEAAAIAAQQQKATVWVCDSFSHEHVGPGGLLDFHDAELQRMAGNDFDKRERMKAAAWIKPKGEHKHLMQRLWQLNVHLILCCQAEKKIALVKIADGPKRGKIDFVDMGFQPVCGSDIPYAMTFSFMFDVKQPGVPIVIKPMLPGTDKLIDLKSQIDETTGERIAAWASGTKRAAPPEPVSTARPPASAAVPVDEGEPPPGQEIPDDLPPSPPPEDTETPPPADDQPPPSPPPEDLEMPPDQSTLEERITDGARELAMQFKAVKDRQSHLELVDKAEVRKQIEWLRRHRKDLYTSTVKPAVSESWKRTDHSKVTTNDQADLIKDNAGG